MKTVPASQMNQRYWKTEEELASVTAEQWFAQAQDAWALAKAMLSVVMLDLARAVAALDSGRDR